MKVEHLRGFIICSVRHTSLVISSGEIFPKQNVEPRSRTRCVRCPLGGKWRDSAERGFAINNALYLSPFVTRGYS